MTAISVRTHDALVSLRMPRAFEVLDQLLLEGYTACEGPLAHQQWEKHSSPWSPNAVQTRAMSSDKH